MADWPEGWVGFIPWLGALEKGFFKEAGLDINVVFPPQGPDPPKLIGTGKADLGITVGTDLLVAASQGITDNLAVAALWDHNPEGLACWVDKVKNPEDVYGKTVAIYNFPSAQLFFGMWAKFHNIDLSKLTIVDEGADGVALALSGKADCIDVSAGGLVRMQTQGKKDATFWIYDSTNGIPNLYNSIITANKTFAKQHPDAVKAFVAALLKARTYMEASPANTQEFVDIYSKQYPATDPAANKAGWAGMEKYALPPYLPGKPLGYIDPATWVQEASMLLDAKMIDAAIADPGQYQTNDYLPAP